MNNPNAINNLTPFKPGESGNPNGHPKGQKNRSTVARQILQMRAILPKAKFDKLKETYPEIVDNMTVEEIMTIVQASNAIAKADERSYRAIMDSAYGAPKQEIDHSTLGEKLPAPIIHIGSAPPLASSENDIELS